MYLRRERRPEERVEVTEVTTGTCAVGVWGPRARDLVQSISPNDLSNEAFPYLTAQEIEVLDVPVMAQRISYAGELGWEMYTEAALGRRLWDVLWQAGQAFGLVGCGRSAYDGLRMEKGYRAWGTGMTEEDDPDEAGIGFTARRLAKGDFTWARTLARRKNRCTDLASHALYDPRTSRPREPVRFGPMRSLATCAARRNGHRVGPAAHQRVAADWTRRLLRERRWSVEWFGQPLPATVAGIPVWDPAGARIRG